MPGPNRWGLEERYCSRGDMLPLGRGRGKGWGWHVGPLMERRPGGLGRQVSSELSDGLLSV